MTTNIRYKSRVIKSGKSNKGGVSAEIWTFKLHLKLRSRITVNVLLSPLSFTLNEMPGRRFASSHLFLFSDLHRF